MDPEHQGLILHLLNQFYLQINLHLTHYPKDLESHENNNNLDHYSLAMQLHMS